MKIQLPENIDPNRFGQYVLILEVHPERFAFFLYHPDNETEQFYCRFPVDQRLSAFAQFQEAFFNHVFFTSSFRKILIVNRTPVFTYVPNLLFEEKHKEAYMQFLFTTVHGKILHQTLSDMTILHVVPEDIYGFLQRSFPEAPVVHHTAAPIAWCKEKGEAIDADRMIIFRQPDGADILCFSRQQMLLSNYFRCQSTEDVVYYALYIFKQLKFNQLKDFIYLVEAEEELRERLNKYIQNVVPCEDSQWKIQKSAI
ncbi:MAG: DUF3822 family protein [Dysgonamonadaceae bacterium]|jgi:hypothetical protein|nr:DUF3822 family protein [Dysgonamonadaceae bacterium]